MEVQKSAINSNMAYLGIATRLFFSDGIYIVCLKDYFHPLVNKICKRHVVITNTINQSFSLTVIAKPTTDTAKAKRVIFFFIFILQKFY